MQLNEAREEFIQAWGTLGSKWGINRTMAQVHALLLLSPEALSSEEVMGTLHISQGNANMSLRGLIDWGVVTKMHKTGERKDFYRAEKDMWKIARQVIIERRKRELEPVLRMLDNVKEVEGDKSNPEYKEFIAVLDGLEGFSGKVDRAFDRMIKADSNFVMKTLVSYMLK